MNKHLKYLKYVLKHKWYVFRECLKYGLIWQGVIHDWQKFTPVEWNAYAWTFYGPWNYNDRPDWLKESFDVAWLHHQHYGPHHWQYWVLREDSGNIKLIRIPEKYLKEMISDWRGAGRAITGEDNTKGWYIDNMDKIKLHPESKAWVEKELGL